MKRKGTSLLTSPSFLRLVLAASVAVVLFLSALYGYDRVAGFLVVKETIVSGNRYLSEDEVISLLKVNRGEGILRLDSDQLRENLMSSPWIREATIRKELPHTLIVNIREAEPLALLKRKGHLYIIDREGRSLEKLNQTIPFLPVIKAYSDDKGLFKEGLKLAETIRNRDFFPNEEIVIQVREPEEITLQVGKMIVRVGMGDYGEKLQRFAELKEEIVNRGIPVDYVDLRFSRRVIVRPVKAVDDE